MTSFRNSLKAVLAVASLASLPALADDAVPETYTHKVLSKIGAHTIYPAAAERQAEEGVVTLDLVVDHQGNLAGVKLVNSSGNAAFDRAALQAAVTAAPFPAPAEPQAEVRGKIRFSL